MAKLSRLGARNAYFTLSILVGTGCLVAPAQAQTNSAAPAARTGGVEEVVVTAQRRSVSIQNTAIAITALTADSLEKSNVTQLSNINGLVPSLSVTSTSGFETNVSIRGVGNETPENAPVTTPGVSLFIDGVYIANTISLDESLFDLERMEVLRGPQGVLYGQSSIGGAINLISKQPVLGEVSGALNVTVGDYNLYRIQGEVNLPLGETMAVRMSAQKNTHRGFTRNADYPNYYLDDKDDVSGKIAFLWQPTSNFKATLTEQYYNAGQNGAAQKNIIDPSPDPRVLSQDYPSKFNLNTNLVHLNMDWDLSWATVKSISAYQYLSHRQQEDGDRSTYSVIGRYDHLAAWNTGLKNFTQELDLVSHDNSKFSWITGLFLMHQKSTQFVAEFQGFTPPNLNQTVPADVQTNPPADMNYGNDSRVTKKSFAVFAQGTYQFTDAASVTLGARYNYDNYKLISKNFSAFGSSIANRESTTRKPTFRGEFDYKVAPQSLLYASISRGYKPGGVNGTGNRAFTSINFKPETNTAYEVGSKNTFLDNTLRVNLAGFFYDYKNMQYIATDPVPFVGGIENIPSVHVWGGEAEVSYVSPDGNLHLNGNLSLENGKVQGSYKTLNSTIVNAIVGSNPNCAFGGAYYNPACWAAVIASAQDIGGNRPPKMPTVAGSVSASYTFQTSIGDLTPRVQYVYRGSLWSRIFAEPALDKVPSYNLVNLNLNYLPRNSNFAVSLSVTNVADVAGVNSRYTDPFGIGSTSQQYIPPRQFFAKVSYQF